MVVLELLYCEGNYEARKTSSIKSLVQQGSAISSHYKGAAKKQSHTIQIKPDKENNRKCIRKLAIKVVIKLLENASWSVLLRMYLGRLIVPFFDCKDVVDTRGRMD